MIGYKTGDILAEDAEALVNTVNCVGFMGRGIALTFKRAWPENFRAYAAACRTGEVQPGRMFVSETGQLGNPRADVRPRSERAMKVLADVRVVVFEPHRTAAPRTVLAEPGWLTPANN